MGWKGWDRCDDHVSRSRMSWKRDLGRCMLILNRSGPDEFKSRGVMKNWSAAEAAKGIEVPTLVINGVNEGASDEAVKPFVEGIKNVKWIKLKNSTHCPLHEEKENYLKIVSEFLVLE